MTRDAEKLVSIDYSYEERVMNLFFKAHLKTFVALEKGEEVDMKSGRNMCHDVKSR
jgi:hypothetical protein